MMKYIGRFLFVILTFVPIAFVDGFDETVKNAKEFIRTGK